MIPPSLIARYRCYGGDNNAADRNVLKDLSGCGNDITLNGFAWSGESGYGSYATDLTMFYPNDQSQLLDVHKDYRKVSFKAAEAHIKLWTPLYTFASYLKTDKFLLRATHDWQLRDPFSSEHNVIAQGNSGEMVEVLIPEDVSALNLYIIGYVSAGETVELYQEPYHKGALVFDGVDDYGLCDTFPVLNKEDGFTIIALRKWIGDMQNSACLCAIGTGDSDWSSKHAAVLEYKEHTVYYNRSFGANIHKTSDYWADGPFVYMTSKSYNGELDFPTVTDTVQVDPTLKLCMLYNDAQKMPFALYALEVYSRDLSEDEMNRVKDRLMEEYLRETNCLDGLEYVAEWQTYGKTNTDEDRNVLKDLSGNGHDITLYNFDYTEQSGYNTADYKGALVTDGVDDYGHTVNAIDDEVGTMICRLVPFASQGQRYYLETKGVAGTDPQRLYIWNSTADTPSIALGNKDENSVIDRSWPIISLTRDPVKVTKDLMLSSSIENGSCTTMAFYHLILIRQKCTVEQVECLKWLMDKKYRDYIKNN